MSKLVLAFVTAAGFLAACTDTPDDPDIDPPPPPPPPAAVATVEVEAPPYDLLPGEQVQLVARAFDADGELVTGRTFAWESDNAAVATVNDAGMVTALAAGEVTIYATTDLVAGGAFLSVTALGPTPVGWIDVHPSGTVVLDAGATTLLTATVYDDDGQVLEGRTVTWSSSDAGVATVSSTGFVTALTAGDAWITVECEGLLDDMLVRVPDVTEPPVAVDHVTLDYVEISVPVGETMQLVAQPRDAQGEPLARAVTWSSNNAAYVSVDASGLVTAIETGGADITATSEGKSATVRVYATFVSDHTLTSIDGNALPATLGSFTDTSSSGGTTTRTVRVHDGWVVIDHGAGTYEARISGLYVTTAFWVPVPAVYDSSGTVTVTPATGEMTFTPQLGTAFTGRWVAGALELHWQPDARMSNVPTLRFAQQ
ncbi:MAG TPA: Ig-like domain-containing protein [Kofleriaceae bacterium]|nr:Ig-like domain-containing protein [Kofleriaceae bacterium]